MRQSGYLVLADISGYTAYLTGSELEHAQDILGKLFGALLERLRPPLRVSNFQGDAVLAYLLDGGLTRGQTVLESLETMYGAFAAARDRVQRNTSCDCCRACSNIGGLDLKMALHHGEFLTHTVGGREELSGPNVILAHRLLKNSVRETTGIPAYLLITQAAAGALSLGALAEAMQPHRESYEHMGTVELLVHDLGATWRREQVRGRALQRESEDARAWSTLELELPIPAAVAWELLTGPGQREQWQDAGRVSLSGATDGRIGVGTSGRCASGRAIDDFAIVDWEPFGYFAEEHPLPLGGTVRHAVRLEDTESGCLVVWQIVPGDARSTAPHRRAGDELRRRLLARPLRLRTERALARLRELAAVSAQRRA